jgi:hypothetical protein
MSDREASSPVLLVGGDLNAVARVEAACAAANRTFRHVAPGRLASELVEGGPVLVLVDIDSSPEALEVIADHGGEGTTSIAFFSHVDEAAGRRAAAAGIKALPRGRFWRELQELVRGS